MKKVFKKIVITTVTFGFFVGAIPAFADSKCADPWGLLDPKCFKLR